MKRLATIFTFMAALAAVIGTVSCADPADPVDYGQLCLPATDDCPDHVVLERPTVGRNALDFTLETRSAASSDSTAVIRITTDGDDEALEDLGARPHTEYGDIILFEEEYPLAEDEALSEHLGSYELTVASRLHLEIECLAGDCDHRLDYIYFTDSIECVDDNVCGRHEFCEQAYGRCAECIDDEQCDGNQDCDRETGYCSPGETTGCQTATSVGELIPALFVVIAVALLIAVAKTRRLLEAGATAAAVSIALVIVLSPSSTQAESGASMHAGGGVRVLTGDAGDLTHPGWGIAVNHQLRWKRIGAIFQLSTHSFGLTGDAAVERGRLTGYGIEVAPTYYIPLPIDVATLDADHPWEALVSLGYTRWNVAENRLAPTTGLDLNYHAIGPAVGLRWQWTDLEFTATARYSHIFDWPGSMVSLDLTIGLGH